MEQLKAASLEVTVSLLPNTIFGRNIIKVRCTHAVSSISLMVDAEVEQGNANIII
jgi:hypothetical protein